MNRYVFDECLDSKRLIASCNEEGKCIADRYPPHMKGTKDPLMLPVILAGEAPLVTTDHTIVEEHWSHIPSENPGIVIIRLRRPSRKMTDKLAGKLLSDFKRAFPDWETQVWSGLCLEITEADVILSRIPPLPDGGHVKFRAVSV